MRGQYLNALTSCVIPLALPCAGCDDGRHGESEQAGREEHPSTSEPATTRPQAHPLASKPADGGPARRRDGQKGRSCPAPPTTMKVSSGDEATRKVTQWNFGPFRVTTSEKVTPPRGLVYRLRKLEPKSRPELEAEVGTELDGQDGPWPAAHPTEEQLRQSAGSKLDEVPVPYYEIRDPRLKNIEASTPEE